MNSSDTKLLLFTARSEDAGGAGAKRREEKRSEIPANADNGSSFSWKSPLCRNGCTKCNINIFREMNFIKVYIYFVVTPARNIIYTQLYIVCEY